ncbi:uncharacterized protein LOC118405856 [Branchiostoma floridae]|uniref:Uncharacterized protein LOC118405856 n=1 Tax=Branchiostoma floridae TaxID=7739 RepID=A0A9J7HL34_BRAFL|nr:uncharacterized protein LOC118405856 [Branchiostoma floridae]
MASEPPMCGEMGLPRYEGTLETAFIYKEIDRPLALCALFQNQMADALNDGKPFDEYVPIAYKTQVVAGTNYTIRIKTGPKSEIGMEVFWPLGSGLPKMTDCYHWGKKGEGPRVLSATVNN